MEDYQNLKSAKSAVGQNFAGLQQGLVAPANPRLLSINLMISSAVTSVRAHVEGLNEKADSIVGRAHTGQGGATSAIPTAAPVPNGALEQIDMSLHELSEALEGLAAVERRFIGLA